jgi:hypothetical protein
MLLTGYMTQPQGNVWRKEKTLGTALSRRPFQGTTSVGSSAAPTLWMGTKTRTARRTGSGRGTPFDQLNKTAKKYVTATEMVCVGEAMIKYFGPHHLKQFIRGKPTPFSNKV